MLLSRSLHHCANISFTDPGWWHDLHVRAQSRGLTRGRPRAVPLAGKHDPGESERASGGGGEKSGDAVFSLLLWVQSEVANGRAIRSSDFFERFAVFDPRRHKVSRWCLVDPEDIGDVRYYCITCTVLPVLPCRADKPM